MTREPRNLTFNDLHVSPDCWSELRVFLAVATAGSYRNAAQLLNTSIPTVVRSCGRLRDVVGEDVLTTTSRGISLTAAGEQLLRVAAAINQEISSTLRTLGNERDDVVGEVRLSVLEGVAGVLVTPEIGALVSAYPHLSVEIANPTSGTVRRVPHIVVGLDNDDAAYEYFPCGHLFLQPVASKLYIESLLTRSKIDPALMHYVQCSYFTTPIFSKCNHLRSKGETRFSCESSLSYVSAILSDHGVGLLANYTLSDCRLTALPLGVEIAIPLYVGCLRSRKKQPAVKVVFDWLIDLLTERAPWFKQKGLLDPTVRYLDLASSPALYDQ